MTSPLPFLTAIPLFAGIQPATLEALSAGTTWLSLAGGATLFEEGDPSDALFVVVRGTLHVLLNEPGGETRTVGFLSPGSLVGELGVLLAESRSATIQVVRDAELLRVPGDVFMRCLGDDAALGVAVARLLGQRLKRTTRQPRIQARVRTVALVPLGGQPLPGEFAQSLCDALSALGATPSRLSSAGIDRQLGDGVSAISRGEQGDGRILELCDALEREHSVVIYEADPSPGAWTARCLRQADLALLVGDAARPQPPDALEQTVAAGRPAGAIGLVLVRDTPAPSATIDWLRHRSVGGHHHLRLGHRADYQRLARFVTGAANGLVLSGGGARGFAHIGVIKALHELHVPVDVVGGSSMGAIIAAQFAAGYDADAMIDLNRRAFSGSDFSDYTVPSVALRKGASTVRRLTAMFGDRQIEDLPVRFFCITSDLTNARARVHDRGPLWLWTRASCSIPGLAPPISSDGSLLVDGGLLNNLPVDVMRLRCSGAVIAVNVTPTVDLTTDAPLEAHMSGWPHLWRALRPDPMLRSFPNIAQILSRTVFVSSVRDGQEKARLSDLLLEPPLDGVGMGSFDAIDRVVESGYRHALERLAAWPLRPDPALP
jgi:predicted acylesterase/phospholipase RssA/CRP-like cAMP-binding protein